MSASPASLLAAYGRDWDEGSPILVGLEFADVAVYTAPRRVQHALCARGAHGLHDVLGEHGAFAEIDVRLDGRTCDVGIRGEMDYYVVAVHCRAQTWQILDIGADYAEPGIGGVVRVVPVPAGREIVVQRDSLNLGTGEQPVCHMAADESGPADDKELRPPGVYGGGHPAGIVGGFRACRQFDE